MFFYQEFCSTEQSSPTKAWLLVYSYVCKLFCRVGNVCESITTSSEDAIAQVGIHIWDMV